MSFSGWKELKLGDLLDISSSKRIYAKEYVKDGIPFYRGKEIIEKYKGRDVSTELFITNERFHELKNKFGAPRKGDILLTSVGTLGVPYLVRDEEFYFKDGNLTWFRNFKTHCYSEFIYLWIQSEDGKNQIHSKAIGSTQKALTIDTLKKFDINLPPLEEQKSIAHIISTIDEKVETNNQINKKLEEMAQAIFKQWFVDFQFPNEDGEPYKSSGGEMVESELGMIPKGWEVGKIGEVATIIRGASPRPIQDFMSDKGMPWLKISDATNSSGKYIVKIKEFIKEEGISKSRKVTQGTLVLSNSATPGMAKIMLVEACAHDGWLIFSNYIKVSKEFMYYYLVKEREGILSLSNGSVFRNLKTDILKNYTIIIPNAEILGRITKIYICINENIKKRTLENGKLETIRDTLLPKLMSGEIRVPLNNCELDNNFNQIL